MKHLKLYEAFTDDLGFNEFLDKVYKLNTENLEKYREEYEFVKEMRVSYPLLTYYIENSKAGINKRKPSVKLAAAQLAYETLFENIISNEELSDTYSDDKWRDMSILELKDDKIVINASKRFNDSVLPFIKIEVINTYEDILELIFQILDCFLYEEDLEGSFEEDLETYANGIANFHPELAERFISRYPKIEKYGYDKSWFARKQKADKYKGIIKF